MATAHREVHKVAHATARIGTDRYHVDIQAGQHRREDAGHQSFAGWHRDPHHH
jgi:hypothetical protein